MLNVSGSGSKVFGITGPILTVGGVYHTDTSGHGILNITAGGLVDALSITIADRGTAIGDVTVSGSGSELRSRGDLILGNAGSAQGTLDVSNGGSVSVTGNLNVGAAGQGTLNIHNGGIANVSFLSTRGSTTISDAGTLLTATTGIFLGNPNVADVPATGNVVITNSAHVVAGRLWVGAATLGA